MEDGNENSPQLSNLSRRCSIQSGRHPIVRQVPSRREGFRKSFLHRKSQALCRTSGYGGLANSNSVLAFARMIQVRHRSHATYSRQPRQVRKEATVTGSCVCSGSPVPGFFDIFLSPASKLYTSLRLFAQELPDSLISL